MYIYIYSNTYIVIYIYIYDIVMCIIKTYSISHIQVNRAAKGKLPFTSPLAGADGSTEA